MKIRTRSIASTLQSHPSTGMSPLIVPVDGDYPSPLAQNTVEELISAMARLFTPTDHPASVFNSVTDGDFAVLDARPGQHERIRPSRDKVSRSFRGVPTGRPVGEWMKFR